MWVKRKEYDELKKETESNYNRRINLIRENMNLKNRITELLKLIYEIKQLCSCNEYGNKETKLKKISELIDEFEGNN